MLDALYRLPPDTTRASLWTTAQTAVSPLLAPAARQVFLPAPGAATAPGTKPSRCALCHYVSGDQPVASGPPPGMCHEGAQRCSCRPATSPG